MSDELRGLPGKPKIVGGLVEPALHRLERRRAVERRVELGRTEAGGVPGERVLLPDVLREERPPPGVVVPARGADADLGRAGGRSALWGDGLCWLRCPRSPDPC